MELYMELIASNKNGGKIRLMRRAMFFFSRRIMRVIKFINVISGINNKRLFFVAIAK
jgi:hypothetical protein